MKQNAFKKLIKEAVREAMQEELKEILVEAIKSPKQTIVETPPPPPINEGAVMSSRDKRAEYQNIMGDIKSSFNTSHVGKPLQLKGSMDTNCTSVIVVFSSVCLMTATESNIMM